MKPGRMLALAGTMAGVMPLSTQAQIESGLIGYWEFENNLTETSGAHTGGLHDGTATGTEAYTAGPNASFGQCLDLDGSSGVSINNSQSSEAGYATTFDDAINTAGGLSISFWARGWPGQWSPFVAKYGDGGATGYGWQVRPRRSETNVCFTIRQTAGADDPSAGQGTNNAGAGQPVWRHYLATWDAAGNRKIYVDGVEDVALTQTGDTSTPTGGPGNAGAYFLTIGMRDNGSSTFGNFFTGQIDDVAIWNRALDSSEALLLTQQPVSVLVGGFVDTDEDGLSDDDEINVHGTNHEEPDTDFDGVDDFVEVNTPGSDPINDDDPDNDGLLNSEETSGSQNPWTGTTLGTVPPGGDITAWNDNDSDDDGILDGEEVTAGADTYVTNPNLADTDQDGSDDDEEIALSTNPADENDTPVLWAQGLRGYWKFDNDLTDSSYIGADGTLWGAWEDLEIETYATGQFGAAIDLDKTSEQRVEILSVPEDTFDFVGGDVTVSAWIQVESFDQRWQSVLSKGEGNTIRMGRARDSDGMGFSGGTAYDVPLAPATASLYPVNDGNWHHVVGVARNGESYSIYVDGQHVETRTDQIPAIIDKEVPLWIGGNPDTATDVDGAYRTWNGNIDDIAIWKRAMTPEEIATIWNGGTGYDIQYLIDNNVPPIEFTEVVVDHIGFNESGEVEVGVSGLKSTGTYIMKRSILLDGSDWTDVGTSFSGGTTHTFIDDSPPAERAFYAIFDAAP